MQCFMPADLRSQNPPYNHASSLRPTNHHKRSPVSLEGLTLGLAGSGGGSGGSSAGLSPRNLSCLSALIAAATFLAGMAARWDLSWFALLEALQNVDHVLTMRGAALPGLVALGPSTCASVVVC